MAVMVKQQMTAGQFVASYNMWVNLVNLMDSKSGLYGACVSK